MNAYDLELTAVQREIVIIAAREHAVRLSASVCIALVDASGRLAAFLRQPGAFLVSSDLAIDKAWSAASFGMSTSELGAMLETQAVPIRDGLLRRQNLTVVPGGIPILHGGRLIGAVGISGGSAEQDDEIAQAAICALSLTN